MLRMLLMIWKVRFMVFVYMFSVVIVFVEGVLLVSVFICMVVCSKVFVFIWCIVLSCLCVSFRLMFVRLIVCLLVMLIELFVSVSLCMSVVCCIGDSVLVLVSVMNVCDCSVLLISSVVGLLYCMCMVGLLWCSVLLFMYGMLLCMSE